jgi:fructose-1-phosphate kinase PfkB-like protein
MLSPHEFTTLMLIEGAPDQIEPNREELHALLQRQLVTFELLTSGPPQLSVTPQGHAVLKAVARIR